MRKLSALAFGMMMSLSIGCGKDDMDKAISGLESYKNKMCACKDKACTEKVHEEYKKWENDVLEPMFKGKKESDMDKGKMEKADKLDDARKECRRKYRDAEPAPGGDAPPATPPAAPAPAPATP